MVDGESAGGDPGAVLLLLLSVELEFAVVVGQDTEIAHGNDPFGPEDGNVAGEVDVGADRRWCRTPGRLERGRLGGQRGYEQLRRRQRKVMEGIDVQGRHREVGVRG